MRRESLEGNKAGKSRTMAFGLASLNAAITKAALCLLATVLLLAIWMIMLLLKVRTSAATFAMKSTTSDKLQQVLSSVWEGVVRLSA